MKKREIVFLALLPIAILIGFTIGRSSAPFERSIRKAERLSKEGNQGKIEALEVIEAANEFIDIALAKHELEETRHYIALALGEVLVKSEMWLEAEEYLLMAYDVLPSNFNVNYDLGVVYGSLYQIEDSEVQKIEYMDLAKSHLETALIAQPDSADTHYLLGILLYEDYQINEALNHFQTILDAYPDDTSALLSVARIYYDQEKYQDAKKIYLKLENLLSTDHSKYDVVQENLEIINEIIFEEGVNYD